jgi:hypothetical protein
LLWTFPDEVSLVRSHHPMGLCKCRSEGCVGTVVADIGMLADLESLIASNNRLNGPIPAEIGSLKKLKVRRIQASVPWAT